MRSYATMPRGEHPTDQGQAFHLDLPNPRRRFEPPEGMLDRLAPHLADAVPGVTRRPLVDRARPPRIGVLSYMWSNALGSANGAPESLIDRVAHDALREMSVEPLEARRRGVVHGQNEAEIDRVP